MLVGEGDGVLALFVGHRWMPQEDLPCTGVSTAVTALWRAARRRSEVKPTGVAL